MSEIIDQLRADGPQPASDLPHDPNPADKMAGVWRIDPTTSSKGTAQPGVRVNTGRLDAVWYLKDEHESLAVAEVWVDTNSDVLSQLPRKRLPFLLRELPGEIGREARYLLGLGGWD